MTQTEEEGPALLLTVHSEETNNMVLLNEDKVFPGQKGNEKDVWYLDNDASNHIIGVKIFFAELDENMTGQVRFGDSSKI